VRGDDEGAERGDQQRVAVGRGALDLAGADGAGGAGPVVDDEAAAELGLQLQRDGARDHVGGTARRERHDDGHGLLLGPCIGLRRGRQRQQRDRGGREGGPEKDSLLHSD